MYERLDDLDNHILSKLRNSDPGGGSDHKSNYQSKVYAHWQSSYRLTKCWKDVSIRSMVLMKMMCEKKERLYT